MRYFFKKSISCSWSSFLSTLLIASTSFTAFADIPAPEALILDGVPALSDSVKTETSTYTEFRSTSFVGWHPTSFKMLAKQRPIEGTTQQLFEVDEAGKLTQLTNYPERILSATYEPQNGKYLLFTKDEGGSEKAQIYRMDLSSDDHPVTLLSDGRSKNSIGAWSRSRTQLAFQSDVRNGKDADFYVMDPLHPENKRRFAEVSEGSAWSLHDWSPDDRQILASLYKSVTNSSLWIFDVESGKRTRIIPRGFEASTLVSFSSPSWSADGKSIFLVTDWGSEFSRLAKIDLESNELSILTPDTAWDVESYSLSSKRDRIGVVFNEEGMSRLTVLDLDSNNQVVRTRKSKDAPISAFKYFSWHDQFNVGATFVDSASSPGEIFTIDLDSETLNFKQRTFTKTTRDEAFVEPQLVKWKSFDGREIPGFLYSPSPEKFPGKRPVMVVIHGGPESQFRPAFLGRNNFYINQLGVALFFPNIRGSTGYGKTYVDLANGMARESAYEDLNTMLDWIKAQPNLDGDRIFVTGGSYGGHATLAVATRYNDKIRCALDIVGMSNLVTFLKNTEPYRQDLRRAVYGDERIPEVRAFLERIAALNHVDQIQKPLFIVQGHNDPRVPYTEAEQMLKAVQEIGTPVWYIKAMNEGHGFSKKPNQDFQFYATIEFMRRYLLN